MKALHQEATKVIVLGVFLAVANWYIIGHLDRFKQEQVESTRASLQGFWLFEMKTSRSTWNPYKNMKISQLASLTVDANFNVHGVAYKWLEISQKGEIVYPRETRTKAIISGSVIGKRIVLNWDSADSDGRPSIQTFDGEILTEGRKIEVRGSFFSDVAAQFGTFCGKKEDILIFEREFLPKDVCNP